MRNSLHSTVLLAAPDAIEQILIYQSMLGAWPIETERLKQYLTKALREAMSRQGPTLIDVPIERSIKPAL